MSAARRLVLPACSALLLVVVALTVHDDVAHRSLRPDAATAELLGSPPAPTAAAPKTAAHDAQSALKAKLASVDVDGQVGDAVVQKLAGAMVKVHKGKAMPKSDVLKAAEDITKVIEDGKDDDASVKNIIAGSKTHGGKDSGSTSLFKELHAAALAKKGKKSTSLSADISSALDMSKARSKKQIKMAQMEALAIAKVLKQSKQDLGVGKIIKKNSESHGGTKDWNDFWGSKHSLVSRLAAEVGTKSGANAQGAASASSKASSAAPAAAAQAGGAAAPPPAKHAHRADRKHVPAAVRNMWRLLKEAKAHK